MAESTKGTFGRSGKGLMDFLDYAMQTSRVPPQMAANYKVSCTDILRTALGDEWARTDVTALDMEVVRRRVVAAKGENHLPRFQQYCLPAIAEFKSYLGIVDVPSPGPVREPPASVPAPEAPPPESRPVVLPQPEPAPIPVAPPPPGPSRPPSASPAPSPLREVRTMNPSPALPSFGIIPHLFPLRDGVLATLLLPANLTSQEAKRLAGFIESLAMPDDATAAPAAAADSHSNGAATMSMSS